MVTWVLIIPEAKTTTKKVFTEEIKKQQTAFVFSNDGPVIWIPCGNFVNQASFALREEARWAVRTVSPFGVSFGI